MIKISVIIPCFNEEKGLQKVLAEFPLPLLKLNRIKLDIIVVDNNSTDKTAQVAKAGGAEVIFETKQGKGNAIIAGLRAISPDTQYVVMLDGDNTYKSYEIMRMIEPLMSNFCDVVVGSRLGGKITKGSMRFSNRVGNWFFSFLVRVGYTANITDVLTGYFAWKYEVVNKLRECLNSTGFNIEMEMITKMAKMGYEIYSVPITYNERIGQSNLSMYKDGWTILKEYLRNLNWTPKMKCKKNIKIAYVSDAIYPYNKGGKEKRLFDITTRLAKKGYQVHIYCMKWWKSASMEIEENGVTLHAICPYIPLYSGNRRSIRQAIIFGFACLRLIKEKFDIIDVDHMPHFPVIFTALVCMLKRKPLISTWNEVWGRDYWLTYIGKKGNLAYIIERLSAYLSKKIISVSKLTTDKLIKEFSVSQIETIANGVDLELIKQTEPALEHSDIFFCGRLLSHKNVDALIKAVSILKAGAINLQCLIVGEGPEKDKLIKQSRKLGLNSQIKFRDFIEDQTALYSLIKATKLFVSPSTREGFGMAVLEANACGVPVLVIDHPDNAAKDMVEHGINGFVSPLDPVIIADTIKTYLLSKNSYNPKQHVLKYDWDNIICKIEKAYNLI